MALQNLYHLRRVAPTASKPCMICYKPTCSVLITPDSKDFFYTCDGHLKDPGFASPVIDKQEEEAKKKAAEMDKAIDEVKKEYEEKMKARKRRKAEKGEKDEKDKEKKEKENEVKEEDMKDEKERDQKIKALESGGAAAMAKGEDGPRIFTLHRNVYQMRLSRIQNAAQARRTAERMRNPTTFPTVPTGDP